MTRRLSYSASAERDLIDIAIYVSDAAQSDAAGDSVVERLDAKCLSLALLPGLLGRARPEIGEGVRSFPFRGYVIFFRYREDVFEVVNVLDGWRDVDAYFGKD